MWLEPLWLAAGLGNNSLADYGVLGAVLSLSLGALAWIARLFIKRESDRADRLEADLRIANQKPLDIFTETVMPALDKTADTVKEFSNLQQRVHDFLERLLEIERRERP